MAEELPQHPLSPADIDYVIDEILQYDSDTPFNRSQVGEILDMHGWALRYAMASFREDRDLVLRAVANHGMALEFAGDTLTRDRDVVSVAVKQNGMALMYAEKGLWYDRSLVIQAVSSHGQVLEFAHKEFRNDKHIVKRAVANDARALLFATPDLRASRLYAMDLVSLNKMAFNYLPANLRADPAVIRAACGKSGTPPPAPRKATSQGPQDNLPKVRLGQSKALRGRSIPLRRPLPKPVVQQQPPPQHSEP
mmetsp:Transcript_42917/g.77988  ORF Transcript_42917/g.77988 Transcript_42917/m.77988 type:complete len:251 (-) Transcript_42917:57-809(-)